MEHRIIQGDCIETLKTLASESVHCCVTSPPYFGLRDYGVGGQIGLEATPQEFIAAMVTVFEEVRRVLRADGVLFLNLGDSYNANQGSGFNAHSKTRPHLSGEGVGQKRIDAASRNTRVKGTDSWKPKDLMLMPHRVAIALQEAGWWVRSDMPWVKRSAMPESVTDRPAKALEYVFMLTKSERYFYDAEAVRVRSDWIPTQNTPEHRKYDKSNGNRNGTGNSSLGGMSTRDRSLPTNRNGITDHLDETPAGSRNFRNADLWFSSIKEPHGLVSIGDELVGLDVNPSGFKDAHFATFPPKLIEPLIKAGTSEHGCCATCGSPYERLTNVAYSNPGNRSTNGPRSVGNRDFTAGFEQRLEKTSDTIGWQKTCKCETDEVKPCVVLDPFNGAGTTMLVSKRLGRRSIGIELNPEYIKIAERRLAHWHRAQPPKVEAESALGPLFEIAQEQLF